MAEIRDVPRRTNGPVIERDPQTFAPPLLREPTEEVDHVVKMDHLAKELDSQRGPRLTRIAEIVETLTFGEMIQFIKELSIIGKLISEMTMWNWAVTRSGAGDKAEEVFANLEKKKSGEPDEPASNSKAEGN